MPLIKIQESATECKWWFESECSRDRVYDAEENEWNSRHAALFVNDWAGSGPKDYDWSEAGALAAAQQCEILINGPMSEHLKARSKDFDYIAIPLNDASNSKVVSLRLKAEELRVEFEGLSKRWQRDTRHLSQISKKVGHPAYLRIIGMGEAAIPLLLEALRDRPTHWFAALRATANTDPCPIDANPSGARIAWLSWGSSHGYID